MKKIPWMAGGIVLAVVVGYIAAGPYLIVSAIKTGIVEKDFERLSENIDFSTLRQNMKRRSNTVEMERVAAQLFTQGNLFTGLVTGLMVESLHPIDDRLIDLYLTPSGLAYWMRGEKSIKNEKNGSAPSLKKDDLLKNARFSYDSINKFSIWMPNDKGKEIRFVLKRNGFSWKLVNLIIPNG